MKFKQVREEMTDVAVSMEYVMRGYYWLSLDDLADACCRSKVEIEFILEQMICFGMVHRDKWGSVFINPGLQELSRRCVTGIGTTVPIFSLQKHHKIFIIFLSWEIYNQHPQNRQIWRFFYALKMGATVCATRL